MITPSGPAAGVPCSDANYSVSLQCQPCLPCPECPPTAIRENEPCPNYPDNFNSGCASDGSVHVTPIQCNEDICGTLWTVAAQSAYDRDVYQITTTAYDSITWNVVSNVMTEVQILEPLGCSGVITHAQLYTAKCVPLFVGKCLPPGTYWLTVSTLQQINVPCEPYTASVRCIPCQPACAICPPTAIHENEPCPGYNLNFNDGCNHSPVHVSHIACGDTICGTSNFYDLPDPDFFEFTITQRDTVRWCVTAMFDVAAAIYTPDPVCANMISHASGNAPPCTPLCVAACLPPGTYWAVVRPTVSMGSPVCQPYVASLHCAPCPSGNVCNYASFDFDPTNDSCRYNNIQLSCGDTVCGNIITPNDRDWYVLDIPNGTPCSQVTINVFGNDTPGMFPYGQGLDPGVGLYSGDCITQFGVDNNGGVGNDAQLVSACLRPGMYHIQVGGFGGTHGPYILALTCTPCPCPPPCPYPDRESEPLNNTCHSGNPQLSCPDTVCGDIHQSNGVADVDWYNLTIPSPGCTRVTINVFGNDTPGQYPYLQGLNPAVALFDASCGIQLAFDDSSGVGNDARLVSACLNPGVYNIRVTGVGTEGPYVLATSCAPCICPNICPFPNLDFDPANDVCAQANVTLACGDTLCGDILPPNAAGLSDVDWYIVQIPGHDCGIIQVDVYGNDTPGWYPFGGGLNPKVWLYAADCTTLLAFDDSSGVGNDASLTTSCLPAGSYRIKVEGVSGSHGPYVLATLCASCICGCSVTCPTGYVAEGEACPNLGPDTYNGGCSMIPPSFSTITCGSRICGTSFAMGGIKDSDWYRFNLTTPRRILWVVRAGFPFEMGIYSPVNVCDSLLTVRYNTGQSCQTRFIFTPCLPIGTYYFKIAPTVTNGVPCSNYYTSLSCGHCIVHAVTIDLFNQNVRLTWAADETMPVYNIYRSSSLLADPSPANLIGSTSDSTFLDPVRLPDGGPKAFYTVTMQDPPDSLGTTP